MSPVNEVVTSPTGGEHLDHDQTEGTNASPLDNVSLNAELGRALERHEFRLHYQPIMDLTGRIVALEALLRWEHPQLMVAPHQFIPLAEQTGLIPPIGDWVLRNACIQNKAWQDQGLARVRVAVNLSPSQLRQEDFAQKVQNILTETGLEPKHLELELRETVMLSDTQLALAGLSELRQKGVHLAVDGFGTGYASVGQLSTGVFHHLKISRFYIQGLPDEQDARIIEAIISLAKTLDLKVVAGGVESEEQHAFLRTHNCDMVQGFLFSEPLPPDKLAQLLREGPRLPVAGST